MAPKLFVATKAFILYQDKVLLLRESTKYADGTNVGRYDVPGGRIEPGQNFHDSLVREIREETSLGVKVGRPFYIGEWRPVVRGEEWQVVGIYFECFSDYDQIKLSLDHDSYMWIKPKDFKAYNLIPNVVGAFEAYFNLGK